MPDKIQITVNGEAREFAAQPTVATLLQELQLNPLHVAVEVNLGLVPRESHQQCVLASGDKVEVVTLVGGG